SGRLITEEHPSAGRILKGVTLDDLPQCLPFQTQPQKDDFYPFVDAEEWNNAVLFVNEKVSKAGIDKHFARMKAASPRLYAQYCNQNKFTSAHTLFKKVYKMNGGLSWTKKTFTVPGSDKPFDLWMRDPLEVVRRLIGNPIWGK